MIQQTFNFAKLCPFVHGRRCLLELGHYGMHRDGKQHHNTPDTWSRKR